MCMPSLVPVGTCEAASPSSRIVCSYLLALRHVSVVTVVAVATAATLATATLATAVPAAAALVVGTLLGLAVVGS